VLDILASLVEKSLVMLDERESRARYQMLETIRDYAREKLERAGDTATTAARHCQHYFEMTKAANRGLRGPEQAHWIERIETELDNVRGATALALAGGVDAFICVKIAVAMQGFWIIRGYGSEGRNVVRAALALPAVQASDMAQAYALYVGAALAESQSDYAEGRGMLQTCLELRRRLGNPIDIAATLSTLSVAQLAMGDATSAREGEQEALAIFRKSGDQVGEAALRVVMPLLEAPVADRPNWTIPRLMAEIEAREGVKIGRSQLSKALRKKTSAGGGHGTR
jgi:tetratricopeptide (TPR) repeat protein